jgi:hypothetical protein
MKPRGGGKVSGVSQITLTGSAYSGFVHYFHFASGEAMGTCEDRILALGKTFAKVNATESRIIPERKRRLQ